MTEQEHVEETMRQIHLLLAQSQQMKGMEGFIIVDRERLFELLEEINRCMYSMMDSYEISKQAHATALKRTERKCEQMIKSSRKTADDIYAASLIYMEDAMKTLFKRMQGFQTDLNQASAAFSQDIESRLDAVEANHKDLRRQLKDIIDEDTYQKAVESVHTELGIEEELVEEVKTPYRPLKRPRRWGAKPEETAKPAVSITVNSSYDEEAMITPKEEKETEPVEVKIDTDAVYFVQKELEEEERLEREKAEQEKLEAENAEAKEPETEDTEAETPPAEIEEIDLNDLEEEEKKEEREVEKVE